MEYVDMPGVMGGSSAGNEEKARLNGSLTCSDQGNAFAPMTDQEDLRTAPSTPKDLGCYALHNNGAEDYPNTED